MSARPTRAASGRPASSMTRRLRCMRSPWGAKTSEPMCAGSVVMQSLPLGEVPFQTCPATTSERTSTL